MSANTLPFLKLSFKLLNDNYINDSCGCQFI